MAQIAERAGVTKSTSFRHFSDKRELLVAGQETLSRLLADGITEAPADASPLEAVAAGLERTSSAMGPANRELGPRLKAPWRPAPNSKSAMPSRTSVSQPP
ncbi:TetR/AcrR family transcriptional regulator [Nonomuraea insulae]|uniref:TetR/AcrR family transcriptional regulator n=1 Tax=Nonomuraea insulae TaxID=1616787 RepID=A0ABW1CKY0_9ACTN